MSEYPGYNGYTQPEPPPKKSGGAWKVIAAIGASLLVIAIVICSTAVFITWLTNVGGMDFDLFNRGNNIPAVTTEASTKPDVPATTSGESTTFTTTPPETVDNTPTTTRPLPGTVQTGEPVSGDALSVSEVYANNVDAVVSIIVNGVTSNGWQQYPFTSSGSGFIISRDGYIITCQHVVQDGTEFKVSLYNGTEYDAEYIGGDTLYDVAVLKINAENLHTVSLGDSDSLIVGEDAIVIGNPLSLTFSVTRGIISATDRVIDVDENEEISVFQTDAAVNSGNSGGPVFNNRGEVIGLVDAKYAAEGVEGLGFAVPINQVMDVAEDLISYGYVTGRPYFGISASTASVDRGWAVNGARVESVDPESCSAVAGLQIGDIIIGIDGRTIESASDLVSERNNFRAGDTAELTVWRAGESITLTITFDEAR